MQGLDAHLNKQLADYQAELDAPVRGKDLTRQQLITWLIEDDINGSSMDELVDDLSVILTSGFEGYENMTTSELVDEYDLRNE